MSTSASLIPDFMSGYVSGGDCLQTQAPRLASRLGREAVEHVDEHEAGVQPEGYAQRCVAAAMG